MNYHVTGILNALLFLLSVAGLVTQLRLVWERKEAHRLGQLKEGPTAVLSLNQFVSSFLAFFSFLLYGMCLERFNHYLVWPRLAGSVLTLAVLWEIMVTRRDRASTFYFALCLVLLIAGPGILLIYPAADIWGRGVSQGLIVAITVVLAQGYGHQIVLMRKSGRVGAVSLRLHQYFFIKDVSTIVFALTMGIGTGWPLLLLATVSAITKLATMWHFRWVRLSPKAERRRLGDEEIGVELSP